MTVLFFLQKMCYNLVRLFLERFSKNASKVFFVTIWWQEVKIGDRMSFKDNLLTQEEMKEKIELFKKEGKKVVFTNGVFDILHIGHLTYLEEAKSLGDVLVVAVNSDASVKVNKGDKRPINNEKTPEKVLDLLKPDIHVKGGDYKKEDLPETKIVEKNGGEVKILSFVDNISTTEIINRILEAYK